MTKQSRYAVYLLMSAAAVCVMALATDVTDVGLLLGETLPFYAAIFILLWNGALTASGKDHSDVQSGSGPRDGSPKPAD